MYFRVKKTKTSIDFTYLNKIIEYPTLEETHKGHWVQLMVRFIILIWLILMELSSSSLDIFIFTWGLNQARLSQMLVLSICEQVNTYK